MSRIIPPAFLATLHAIRDYQIDCRRRGVKPEQCVQKTTAMREVFAFVGAPDVHLCILSGDFGSGKSFAAATGAFDVDRQVRAGVWLNAHQTRPQWVSMPEIASAPRWTKGESLGISDLLSALKPPALVVIDEVGQEESTSESNARLQELVNTRLQRKAKTLITTNLDGAAFRDQYGGRIRSRLREGGITSTGASRWWVNCTEDDMRGTTTPTIPDYTPPEPEPSVLTPEEMRGAAAEMLQRIADAKVLEQHAPKDADA